MASLELPTVKVPGVADNGSSLPYGQYMAAAGQARALSVLVPTGQSARRWKRKGELPTSQGRLAHAKRAARTEAAWAVVGAICVRGATGTHCACSTQLARASTRVAPCSWAARLAERGAGFAGEPTCSACATLPGDSRGSGTGGAQLTPQLVAGRAGAVGTAAQLDGHRDWQQAVIAAHADRRTDGRSARGTYTDATQRGVRCTSHERCRRVPYQLHRVAGGGVRG